MPALSDLCESLNHQFLDPQNLVIPGDTQTEAVREALAGMNAFLGTQYTLEGLDSAPTSSLPDRYVPVLLCGAAAFALDFSLRKRLGGFASAIGREETMRLWCEHLSRQFDAGLDRLRLLTLQSEASAPFGAWVWNESPHWRTEGEA
ncbi:MAG TPA: hypothetical protein PKL82_01065 [Anaerolineaceae bacterium]|nr:hypothetical protein [Anaerolineaceae bacterium]NMD27702.1 hypothetical protein [Chloroflexota bacterium]HOA21062.1 hypothetical protein [Anaerolineaceae bacterium]HOG77717.1 hypothetical protein [Anaerolineaceae bacterium]